MSSKKKALLAPLEKAEYDQATVPSPESIRAAFRQAADGMRQAARKTKRGGVDAGLRFRWPQMRA